MHIQKSNIIKDNLLAFWSQCFLTNPDFKVVSKNKVFHIAADFNDPMLNTVLWSNFPSEEITTGIKEIQSYYEKLNHSFCWWVNSIDNSEQLSNQLTENQFNLIFTLTGMIINLDAVKAIPLSSDIEIIEVKNNSDVALWINPIEIGFGLSSMSKEKYLNMFEKLSNAENSPIHFIAKYKNEIVGSSTLFRDKVAGIYNCATLPEYRGKGILSSLTTAMISKAKELGYHQATLQATPLSVNLFRKFGFEDILSYQVYLKN